MFHLYEGAKEVAQCYKTPTNFDADIYNLVGVFFVCLFICFLSTMVILKTQVTL